MVKKKPKILVRKGKKKFFEDLGRDVTIVKQAYFYIPDTSKPKPFSTKYGTIRSSDLKKTGRIRSDQDKEFHVFDASFIDRYRRIRRLPQIIPLKDIGMIISTTGIGPDSRVVEGGAGSGALSILLARYVNRVFSYDVNKEHLDVVKENIKELGIKNVSLKNKSLYSPISEKDIDLFCLDLPEPWEAIDTAYRSLKPGGFLVSYSPTIPQVQDFVNSILEHDSFLHLKTIDLLEQEWQVEGRKVRPKSRQIVHSGFLTFVRKLS